MIGIGKGQRQGVEEDRRPLFTVAASSKDTPCFWRLALPSPHSTHKSRFSVAQSARLVAVSKSVAEDYPFVEVLEVSKSLCNSSLPSCSSRLRARRLPLLGVSQSSRGRP